MKNKEEECNEKWNRIDERKRGKEVKKEEKKREKEEERKNGKEM